MTTKDPYLTRADFAAWTKKFSEWRKAADDRHEEQRKDLNVALARISQLENRKAHPQTTSAGPSTVASDADLTGERGDPKVERNPPRWDGDDMTGRRWSQTSTSFLECMAGFLEWKADNPREGKEKYSQYDRKDAARARAWAARLAPGSAWSADAPDVEGDPDPDPFNGDDDSGGDLVPF